MEPHVCNLWCEGELHAELFNAEGSEMARGFDQACGLLAQMVGLIFVGWQAVALNPQGGPGLRHGDTIGPRTRVVIWGRRP